MEDEYLEYIKNEKDISVYKTSLLRKKKDKEYRHRLISIEEDFVSYPFEDMDFDSLDALRSAMLLFKSDRNAFNIEHVDAWSLKERVITDGQIRTLRDKILYCDSLYRYLLDSMIKDFKLVNPNASHNGLPGPSDEGAIASKKRARIQILIYCLSRFIHGKVKVMNSGMDKTLSPSEYDRVRLSADNLFDNVGDELFKNYNNGISEVPLIINGTSGHNNFIHTVYPLVNLFDKYPDSYSVGRILPGGDPIFSKTGRPIKKRQVERGFGLITNMPRLGNEAIRLLYCNLKSSSGTDISKLFCREFFNVKIDSDYYKAVPTVPIWTIKSNDCDPFFLREVLGLLDLDGESMVDDIDFSSLLVTDKINKTVSSKISLCGKSSKILTAATRSEAEHVQAAKAYVDILIKEIKNDYKAVFDLKDSGSEGRSQRLEGLMNIVNRGSDE